MKRLTAAFIGILAALSLYSMACADSPKCCTSASECGAASKNTSAASANASKDPTEQEIVIDPVCGMDVVAKDAKYSYKYQGKTYHFCSKSCYNSFKKDPAKYIKNTGKSK
ncbi:MAG: YHS domain-containing protein [Nitrospirota bacterium]